MSRVQSPESTHPTKATLYYFSLLHSFFLFFLHSFVDQMNPEEATSLFRATPGFRPVTRLFPPGPYRTAAIRQAFRRDILTTLAIPPEHLWVALEQSGSPRDICEAYKEVLVALVRDVLVQADIFAEAFKRFVTTASCHDLETMADVAIQVLSPTQDEPVLTFWYAKGHPLPSLQHMGTALYEALLDLSPQLVVYFPPLLPGGHAGYVSLSTQGSFVFVDGPPDLGVCK
jgi:hypothetical protein